MDHIITGFILTNESSITLSVLAFILFLTYVYQLKIPESWTNIKLSKYGIIVRAMNWGVFACVFLLFGEVIPFDEVLTWRATARVALLALMLSELAYQSTVMYPILKRKAPWNKHGSQ